MVKHLTSPKPKYLIYILPFLMFSSFSTLTAGWHNRKAEGWAWYEDQKAEAKSIEVKQEECAQKESPDLCPSEQMEKIKEKLQNLLCKAMIEPTEENVKAYMEEQNKWISHAGDFSTAWVKALLSNPQLDAGLEGTPTSQYGINVYKKLKKQKRVDLIAKLADSYGLFFFYEGNNVYSQEFSNVVIKLQERYNWVVVPVSVDGVCLPKFPESRFDKGIAEKMGMKVFPSLVVIDHETAKAYPIAYGLASLDMVENNIALQFRHLMEDAN